MAMKVERQLKCRWTGKYGLTSNLGSNSSWKPDCRKKEGKSISKDLSKGKDMGDQQGKGKI